ncbi:hypothetical protein MBLNU459_g1529t1 [Dothideomycetes sp. NU459]
MSQTLKARERMVAIQETLTPLQNSISENPPFPYPVANPIVPYWRTELHEFDSHRTTADLPKECDVLIIGAGYSGASTAYHLLDENPSPPSIVILEAREACSGATGRNGGHLKPDVYFQVPKYQKLFGNEAAAEIARFEASQVYAVKDLVEKENIDCDFTLTRAVDVCLDEEHAAKCKLEFDQLVADKVASVRDVQYAQGRAAEMLSGVKGAKGAFSFTAGSVWPYKMVMHLLKLVVGKGVNLQTHTPVLRVSEKPDADGRWLLSTSRGHVKARRIVFATNAYTSSLLPDYKDKIVPVRGICSRIVVPEGTTIPYLPYTHSVRYGPGLYDYQIPRPDGSIVVGGARQRFWHKLDEWYNVTDDSKLIDLAVPHFRDGLMQKHYRGWENSNAQLAQIWTGIMGYTSDLMPHIGAVPSKPGQYICAGFNGHGMPLILLSSKGVAKMIRDDCEFEDTGIPRVFKTTEARLASTMNAILNVVPS